MRNVRKGVFAGVLLAMFAAGAAQADCPPLGTLANYVGSEPTQRAYAAYTFKVKKGDDTEQVEVRGRYCFTSYEIKDGADVTSDLEIQSNYRDQLRRLGAQILDEGDRETYARLAKDGRETWFYVYSQETGIEVHLIEKQPFKASLAAPAGHDYRLLGHMPQYVASPPEKRNFDQASFRVQEGDDTRDIAVRGAKYFVSYEPKSGAPVASDLEIQENYRAALRALGAQILLNEDRLTTARLEQAGQTVWMSVYSQETGIEVTAIEEKPFQPSIQPADAGKLKTALDQAGRVAIYVNFDFAKATLKPDAAPVIAQVVKLLKENPALKLAVEGHTDNIGGHDLNMKLSQARAAAVVEALAAQGVARGRLTATGFGPDKPIADNGSEEGRAKNRRVELVKS